MFNIILLYGIQKNNNNLGDQNIVNYKSNLTIDMIVLLMPTIFLLFLKLLLFFRMEVPQTGRTKYNLKRYDNLMFSQTEKVKKPI